MKSLQPGSECTFQEPAGHNPSLVDPNHHVICGGNILSFPPKRKYTLSLGLAAYAAEYRKVGRKKTIEATKVVCIVEIGKSCLASSKCDTCSKREVVRLIFSLLGLTQRIGHGNFQRFDLEAANKFNRSEMPECFSPEFHETRRCC